MRNATRTDSTLTNEFVYIGLYYDNRSDASRLSWTWFVTWNLTTTIISANIMSELNERIPSPRINNVELGCSFCAAEFRDCH